ncbi:MAG: RluA family pseudouridine synthase [Blastochloris sp.]|nr:RluA family pseudouridine synthase [Blastochloris sp.]
MKPEPLSYVWKKEDCGERVDRILATGLDVSRTQIQRWIELSLVFKGQEVLGSRSRLKEEDIIRIEVPEMIPSHLIPEDRPLDVVFEDKHLVVINKKAGEVVHPGAGHATGTLVGALLHHCKGELSGIGGVERPGIVHRLDKDTSGLLLVAKNDKAHENLSGQFKDRTIRKWYAAFVVGRPSQLAGIWDGEIGRHPVYRQKMAIRKSGGRPAKTTYRVLKNWVIASKLELEIHTGRTHQIRVHCLAANCPVIGDTVYSRSQLLAKQAQVNRQLLHAWKLHFHHPVSGKIVEVEAPIPDDFNSFEQFLDQQVVATKK